MANPFPDLTFLILTDKIEILPESSAVRLAREMNKVKLCKLFPVQATPISGSNRSTNVNKTKADSDTRIVLHSYFRHTVLFLGQKKFATSKAFTCLG